MTKTRRRKPSDPQEIARRKADREDSENEVQRLRNSGAIVRLDRARRIVSAFRQSPFVKLRDTATISPTQAAAAERLCADWATWKGLGGRPERSEVHAENFQAAEMVTDKMITAGRRVRRVLAQVGPMDRDLLSALVASTVEDDRPLPWRDVVRRTCGVTHPIRQSQMVVAALENLARAYRLPPTERADP